MDSTTPLTPLTPIRRLHQHRQWANRQLRDAARPLSPDQHHQTFDIGAGSLLATLTHLHAAEDVWLNTITDQPTRSPFDYRFDTLADLEPAWDHSEQRWTDYLDRLAPDHLTRPVTKTSSLTGKSYTNPLLDILLHVCTHAHYTTAQAVNILRRLGLPPDQLPDAMLITLARRGN